MDSIAKTLNAPIDIEFDGESYQLSSLDLNDLGAFENHLRKQRVKELCELDIPKKDIHDMVSAANRQAIGVDELMENIATINGLKYVIWRCIQKQKKDVTLDQIGSKIDLNKIAVSFTDFMGLPENAEGEQSEKKPEATA